MIYFENTMTINKNQSLLRCNWKEVSIDINKSMEISEKYNIPHTISSALTHIDNVESYLEPILKRDFPNPHNIPNIQEAADMIIRHLDKKIIIFGDYDVDGSTSTAMLIRYLTKIPNISCDFHIPDRLKEGYGPSIDILSKIQCDLIIFLDCGTNAYNEINYLKSRFIKSIVIDHHMKNDIADTILVNPKEDNIFCNLCTAGLVLMLIIVLDSKLNIDKGENYLYLAAIGTICDMMPLTGVNRLIVKHGIRKLNGHIFQIMFNIKAISSYHIGFKIGPILNAGSRMGDSSLAARFLISEDKNLYDKLVLYNEERKTIQKIIINNIKIKENKTFILIYDTWHKGVIGIVASNLVNKYNIPAFVGNIENNIITFSVRSVENIDISQIIFKAKDILIKGGGHAMAGGFSIYKDNIKQLEQIIAEHIKTKMYKTRYYNGNISIFGISKAKKYLHYIEPTGMNNPILIFQIINVRLYSIKEIKSEIFSICFIDILEQTLYTLCFNLELAMKIKKHIKYNIFTSLSEQSTILEDAIVNCT